MKNEQREQLIAQHLNGRVSVPCTITIVRPAVTQINRVDLVCYGTTRCLHFDHLLPAHMPDPHNHKIKIAIKDIKRLTIVNGTLYLHGEGFEISVPPETNTAKVTTHTLVRGSTVISPGRTYTEARMSHARS